MLGEMVHYVGIPKFKEYYDVWHTEFVVNLEKKYDLTWREFKNIMKAMHSCYVGDPFYKVITQPLHTTTFDYEKKEVEAFVRHDCCWQDQQYVVDEIHEGTITDAYPLSKYAFITLKKIVYTDNPNLINLMIEKRNRDSIIQKSINRDAAIPLPNTFETIREGTVEFDDKYITVRRINHV